VNDRATLSVQEAERKIRELEKMKHLFGELPMVQSREISGRVWTSVSDLNASLVGREVLVRARVNTVRGKGKVAFLVLRDSFHTTQCVAFQSETVPKDMIKFLDVIPRESIVDVTGVVTAPAEPVTGCTVSDVEIALRTVHIVCRASPNLPFSIEDASRKLDASEDEGAGEDSDEVVATPTPAPDAAAAAAAEDADKAEGGAAAGGGGAAAGGGGGARVAVVVKQKMRLDHRWLDLRTPANQGIVRISSMVCTLFREFLLANGFLEIQTPKIIGGTSEGGAEVFRLKYFGRDACLAQSPQLYKQMCAACSDMQRVFEIGPVMRAEDSRTHRHLCEFHGLDLEMVIHEHYYEVLDVFSGLFNYIFRGINERCKRELEAVRAQYPFEDLKFTDPAFRLTFAEATALLRAHGYDASPEEDLNTEKEKALGRIIKDKYGVEFYIVDKYPLSVRPFYTMPDPEDPTLSNSYDIFLRGEEIVSGAQRVHDPAFLEERAIAKGILPETIRSYLTSFKHGAYPHGGGGIGLERVVMLFLGLNNIRKSALFPRDPRRLFP
jgi:aspartyl-tRNA synthetase